MNSDRDDIAITYPVERPLIERAIELLTKQRRTIGQFHKFLVRSSIAFVSAMAIAIIVRLIERALGWTALDLVAAFLLLPLIFAGAALALAFLAGIPQLATQWWFSTTNRSAS